MMEILNRYHLSRGLVLNILHWVRDVSRDLFSRVIFQVLNEQSMLHLVLVSSLPVLAVVDALFQSTC